MTPCSQGRSVSLTAMPGVDGFPKPFFPPGAPCGRMGSWTAPPVASLASAPNGLVERRGFLPRRASHNRQSPLDLSMRDLLMAPPGGSANWSAMASPVPNTGFRLHDLTPGLPDGAAGQAGSNDHWTSRLAGRRHRLEMVEALSQTRGVTRRLLRDEAAARRRTSQTLFRESTFLILPDVLRFSPAEPGAERYGNVDGAPCPPFGKPGLEVRLRRLLSVEGARRVVPGQVNRVDRVGERPLETLADLDDDLARGARPRSPTTWMWPVPRRPRRRGG